MVFPDSSRRPSRLAAVLGPPRSRPAPEVPEPPTVPIPIDDDGWRRPAAAGWDDRAETVAGRVRSGLGRCWPAAWRRARVDPGRPGSTALVLVAIAAAVLAALGVWSQRPQAQPVGGLTELAVLAPAAGNSTPAAGPGAGAGSGVAAGPPGVPGDAASGTTGAGAAPSAAGPGPPPAPLVVSVSGKVRRPGLVEVPTGARVADALTAAGGVLPGTDLSQVNLARRVTDGEQVAVGVPAAPDAAAPAAGAVVGGPGPAGSPPGRIDLNVASADQLDGLPGVGPVTAQRIIEWRTRNGRFTRVEQLREIDGIGERRFVQLRELVTV